VARLMKDKQLVSIENIINNLLSGDIYTPIKTDGIGEYASSLKKLEELRIKLVKIEDDKNEYIKNNHTMLASVAHDMKTPLQIISGYSECLQDGIDDKDYAKLIGEKTEQLNNLVLSLVESSRGEINNLKNKKSVVDSKEYFTKVIEGLSSCVDKKQDKFIVSKIPSARLRLEINNIERVLYNLVSNAVKYSNENSTIKVKFKKTSYWFTIKVIDNGNGIKKEDLPHVFEKFYKEDKSRSDNQSNGLGLYIVKQIIEDHGGVITVKSKKGKGTTFTVRLPIDYDGLDKSLASSFDRLDYSIKLVAYFFLGPYLGFLYRMSKFLKTRKLSTLFGSVLFIGLLPFMYMYDFMSIVAYKKIIFLAD